MPVSDDTRQSNPKLEVIRELPTVTASDLKNNFGEASLRALKGPVAITRHNRAEFVLLPAEQYAELASSRRASLDALADHFDGMVARMNTPAARRGVARLFKATPAALGKAAVKATGARGA